MRIIAGTARGIHITAPDGTKTRPTLDRVKESVFGAIQFDVADSVVLDLFAGSGNLGIEAISRGAKSAVFTDNNRICINIIKGNLNKLKFISKAKVLHMDFEKATEHLAKSKMTFDIIFLDPPYNLGLAERAINSITQLELLNKNGIIVIEHEVELQIKVPRDMYAYSEKRYGVAAVTILKKGSAPN